MEQTKTLSFRIDEQLLAIPIPVVDRIIRAVEVTTLGKTPGTILGIIDYKGEIIPVLNLRKRLGIPDRKLSSSDRFMIIKTSAIRMVLVVDEILDIVPYSNKQIATSGVFPETVEAEGITRSDDGIILIYDPEKFLSSSEELNLKKALERNSKTKKSNNTQKMSGHNE